MKYLKSFRSSIFFLNIISLILLGGCSKDPQMIIKQKVSGLVQKGPFIVGTEISMYELNASMSQTGKVFTSQIIKNDGSFNLNNVNLASSYVEFSSNGFYFDEVSGGISQNPLFLSGISDLADKSTVNLNILTHLEKFRVENLVNQGNSFSDAKKNAQSEVLGIFGFSLIGMDDSEGLDISVNSEENAILLAIMVILQWGNSVPELTEELMNIANDISEDGILDNESIISNLRNSAKDLRLSNYASIRSNLEDRYKELGLDASIPDFEKYINDFLTNSGLKPTVSNNPATKIRASSVTLNGLVNANSLSTNVAFEYGLTSSYGNSIIATPGSVSGLEDTEVSADILGLSPASSYHFRIKSENAKGISYSDDDVFTTTGSAPSILNQYAGSIKLNSAKLTGLINPNDLPTIVLFEYGTSTSYGQIVTAEAGSLNGIRDTIVSLELSGLSENTIYHFRIKAINALGTVLSDDKSYSTCDRLFDVEGNMYKTLAIGTQQWMIENLKTTTLNNGSVLSNNMNGGETPAYCWYSNNETYKNTYGALYNWYTLNSGKICPTFWHVPTANEWYTLINYLGGEEPASDKLKEIGAWPSPSNGTNESSFSAMPGGSYDKGGTFSGLGFYGLWWTSSPIMSNFRSIYLRWDYRVYESTVTYWDKANGLSIRCIKD